MPNSFIIQKQLWEKKTLLQYFCQLEIDHVTQKPKETWQSTCRVPLSLVALSRISYQILIPYSKFIRIFKIMHVLLHLCCLMFSKIFIKFFKTQFYYLDLIDLQYDPLTYSLCLIPDLKLFNLIDIDVVRTSGGCVSLIPKV